MTDRREPNPKPPLHIYKGLRPFDESDHAKFFGRDEDIGVFIDKLLANRFTLMFAASGVGKTSLLRAGVLPQLKSPHDQNLNVVFHNVWVFDPNYMLRQSIGDQLREQGCFEGDEWRDFDDRDLRSFLRDCTLFTSNPLVLILDQFEEFFRYQRNSRNFESFISQLTDVILDSSLRVVTVISMREDFALELNAFRPKLPTLIFQNYYRLEPLKESAAREAMEKPVRAEGYRFEEGALRPDLPDGSSGGRDDGLMETLLNDLSQREFSPGSNAVLDAGRLSIEPPYLQIVCEQLWELERKNSDGIIRLKTYRDHGGASGLLERHLNSIMKKFWIRERQVASRAFDHLVTKRSAKVAYSTTDLAKRIRFDEKLVDRVLSALAAPDARILNFQERESPDDPEQKEGWYELYHDLFTDSIESWNNKFKKAERTVKAFLTATACVFAFGVILFGFNTYQNLYHHHLRLGFVPSSERVEIYQGKAGAWDPMGLQEYVAETDFVRRDLEPDKRLFESRPLHHVDDTANELIERADFNDRLEPYLRAGLYVKARKLIKTAINEDEERANAVINSARRYPAPFITNVLAENFASSSSVGTKAAIIKVLGLRDREGFVGMFRDNLETDSDLRNAAVRVLRSDTDPRFHRAYAEARIDDDFEVYDEVVSAKFWLANSIQTKVIEEGIKRRDQEFVALMFSEIPDATIDVALRSQDNFLELAKSINSRLQQILDNRSIDRPKYELTEKRWAVFFDFLKSDVEKLRSAAVILADYAYFNSGWENLSQELDAVIRQDKPLTQAWVFRNLPNELVGHFSQLAQNVLLSEGMDVGLRQSAAQMLGKSKDDSTAVQTLGACLSLNDAVLESCLDALSAIGTKQARSAIMQYGNLLIGSFKSGIREKYVTALGKSTAAGTEERLAELAGERDEKVRKIAANSLANIHSQAAKGHLRKLLNSNDKSVALAALAGIARQRDLGAMPDLESRLGRTDATSWRPVVHTINLLMGLDARKFWLKHEEQHTPKSADSVSDPIVQWGRQDFPSLHGELFDGLDNNPEFTQLPSQFVPGVFGPPNVRRYLSIAGRPNSVLRKPALEVLAGIGADVALPLFRKVITNPNLIGPVLVNLGSNVPYNSVTTLAHRREGDRISDPLLLLLSKSGEFSATEILIKRSSRAGYKEKSKIIEALGLIADPAAVRFLLSETAGHERRSSSGISAWWALRHLPIPGFNGNGSNPVLMLPADLTDFGQARLEKMLRDAGLRKPVRMNPEQLDKVIDTLLASIEKISRSRFRKTRMEVASLAALQFSKRADRVDLLMAGLAHLDGFVRNQAEAGLRRAKATEVVPRAKALLNSHSPALIHAVRLLAFHGGDIDYTEIAKKYRGSLWLNEIDMFEVDFWSLFDDLQSPEATAKQIAAFFRYEMKMKAQNAEVPFGNTILPVRERYREISSALMRAISYARMSVPWQVWHSLAGDPDVPYLPRLLSAAKLLTYQDADHRPALTLLDEQDTASGRLALLDAFRHMPSPPGSDFVAEQLESPWLNVRLTAMRTLAYIDPVAAREELPVFLTVPNSELQTASAKALVVIGDPADHVETLTALLQAESSTSPLTVAILLDGLVAADSQKANEVMVKVAEQNINLFDLAHLVHLASKPVIANRITEIARRALESQEKRIAAWRMIRDENPKRDNWAKRLRETNVGFRREHDFAYVLALVNPVGEGVELLAHDLADVRKGAAAALGVVGNPDQLEKLIALHEDGETPWLREAAFQAIHQILKKIVFRKDQKALAKLRTVAADVKRKEIASDPKTDPLELPLAAISERLAWTIDKLEKAADEPSK